MYAVVFFVRMNDVIPIFKKKNQLDVGNLENYQPIIANMMFLSKVLERIFANPLLKGYLHEFQRVVCTRPFLLDLRKTVTSLARNQKLELL